MLQTIGRCVVFALWVGTGASGVAQDAGGWRRPPEPIASLVDAPPTPGVSLSPCGRFLLLTTREAMPSIAVMARPYEKLAGLRVDPHARTGQLGVETKSIALRSVATGEDRSIDLPPGHVTGAAWSDDGERIAFTRVSEAGLELWVAKSADASVKKIEGVLLNGVLGGAVQWMPDQKTLLCKLALPGDPPARPAAPGGPSTRIPAAAQRRRSGPIRTCCRTKPTSRDSRSSPCRGLRSSTPIAAASRRRERRI